MTLPIVVLGCGAPDVTQMGGKAAALHRLAWLGFRVPPGFTIVAALHSPDAPDKPPIELSSHEAEAALAAFDLLGSSLVAVRSSAIVEDGADNGFAGQHDTHLNVSRHKLLDRIRECRASAFTERALAYRRQRGIDAPFSMAVLVQEMVDAEISGVCFTQHPTDPEPHLCLIEAVWGLGEGLVSGVVVPDTYVLNSSNGASISENLTVQNFMLARPPKSSDGVVSVIVPSHLQSRRKLSVAQLQQIMHLGKDMESIHEYPCDIEFAITGELIYLLQCRPIAKSEGSMAEGSVHRHAPLAEGRVPPGA
jgi:pyruvate,water dikinase